MARFFVVLDVDDRDYDTPESVALWTEDSLTQTTAWDRKVEAKVYTSLSDIQYDLDREARLERALNPPCDPYP